MILMPLADPERNLGVWEQRRGSPDTEISAERGPSGLRSPGHADVPEKPCGPCAESVNLLGTPVNLLVAVSVFVVLGHGLAPHRKCRRRRCVANAA
jgi:hypothetical protein